MSEESTSLDAVEDSGQLYVMETKKEDRYFCGPLSLSLPFWLKLPLPVMSFSQLVSAFHSFSNPFVSSLPHSQQLMHTWNPSGLAALTPIHDTTETPCLSISRDGSNTGSLDGSYSLFTGTGANQDEKLLGTAPAQTEW